MEYEVLMSGRIARPLAVKTRIDYFQKSMAHCRDFLNLVEILPNRRRRQSPRRADEVMAQMA